MYLSPYVGIISIKKVIRDNQWQLIYIHKKPSKILSRHCGRVNYIPAVSINPEVPRVNSFKTITTEGA